MLYVPKTGEVLVDERKWNGKAEFVHYALYNEEGNKIRQAPWQRGGKYHLMGREVNPICLIFQAAMHYLNWI